MLFSLRDSLGFLSFSSIAERSGVVDLSRFERCTKGNEIQRTVDRDVAAAVAAGGRGTPLVVVNGLMLHSGADSSPAVDAVRKALAKVANR